MNNDSDERDMPPAAPTAQRYPVGFTGSGGEYFRIWIVNLLLTLLTLGIYSAWAKVRKLQYFYRNTRLDSSVFDYHGKPIAILKGRILALVLIGFYNFALQFSIVLGLVAMAVLAALLPWLLTQSQKFKLHYSSYRGLRFRFDGPLREAYFIWGLPLLLFLLPIGLLATLPQDQKPALGVLIGVGLAYLAVLLLMPYLHYRIKRFQHANAHLGQARGRFLGKPLQFYWIYAQALMMFVVLGAVAALLFGAIGVGSKGANRAAMAMLVFGVILVFYLLVLSVAPFLMARVQNCVWNNTLLGSVGFASAVKARKLAFIYVTNLLLIVLTLGLFTPFAAVRMLKYRLSCVTVLSTTDLQGFVAQQGAAEVGAAGEGAADLLDFDFSL